MKLINRLKKATYFAALPAASLLTAVVIPVSAAHAQMPAATMTVLTPKQNEVLGTSRFNLDVRFRSLTNSPVVTAELWVDGVRWVRRDLDAPRRSSVLSFLVDGSTLSSGSHTIVVKVLNAEGSVSSSKVDVVAGSDEAAGEVAWGGPDVRFLNPGNGKKVVGTVELLVDAKSRNGQNPYVSFYVDDKFKTLKNYPPYSFVWDSTNETNGVHTITASGYLDSTNTTTTRKITVYVNNPGGNTRRISEIPDLSAPRTATATAAVAKPLSIPLPKKVTPAIAMPTGEAHVSESISASVAANESLDLSATEAAGSVASAVSPRFVAPKAPIFTPKVVAIPKVTVARKEIVAVPKVAVNATPVVSGEPILSVAGDIVSVDADNTFAGLAQVEIASAKVSIVSPRLSRPMAPVAKPMPTAKVAVVAPVKHSLAVVVPTVTVAVTKVAIAPAATVSVAKVAINPIVKVAPVRMSVAAPKAKVAQRTDSLKPLQVAFDGAKIAFDVAPRVESGMPVAPFRQIFEHTGGKVSWANDTKTMRAVNSNREIVIGVGKKSATVNGSSISMERAASLEHGRTIVPLNFVGKALDVNVQYDPVTGRLSITSKN